jgi:hypothetical protein
MYVILLDYSYKRYNNDTVFVLEQSIMRNIWYVQ